MPPAPRNRCCRRSPASCAAAHAAAESVMQAPAFAPFMAMIDGPSVTLRHDAVALAMH